MLTSYWSWHAKADDAIFECSNRINRVEICTNKTTLRVIYALIYNNTKCFLFVLFKSE